jgi:hypothetical protein
MLWLEGLEDLSYGVLEQALRRTLQVCKYWPVKVADIREQVSRAAEAYANADAELRWERVLEYIRVCWNPDLPGGASSRAPKISPRTMHAIRCAGGLAEIAECPREHLHFKKELFVEAYTSWEKLQRDEYLLPENSPVRALISETLNARPEPVSHERRADLARQGTEIVAKFGTEGKRP